MPTVKVELKKIANFELRELIGAGGMANIYKGLQLSLERPVAIKILHQHLVVNEDFVARFKQEAKQAAILQHQNIVSIIDYGHHDNEYFIAMEYIEGQNLKEVLTRIKRLPLEVAMLIVREVASGLKYAHSQGLIHRDIKPANIMLSKDGRVVITDFGIAKSHNDMSITVTGQTVGSPAYMSPEQAAGRPIDHRCDIFSLGIVFYELVTGEKPFKGDNYQEAMTSIISGIPPDPRSLRVDVTLSMEKIIKKMLEKDIESRFQDTEEIMIMLDEELSNYVIPSEKKLISEFIKNPIKITEKLRTDRISKHMESALYYVNIGHGRLSDAIKEFENVLRYDKNNKLAKQYLDKLKTGQDDFTYRKKSNKLNWIHVLIAIAGVLVIMAASSTLVVWQISRQSTPISVPSGQTTDGATTPPNQLANQPQEPAKDAVVSTPIPPKQDLQQSTAKTSTPVKKSANSGQNKGASSQQNKTTKPAESAEPANLYNYPNQDLAEYGMLKITTKPPVKFSVDFTEYGMTGGPLVKLEPGRHTISIDAPGYRAERKRIFTEEGKTETITIELDPWN